MSEQGETKEQKAERCICPCYTYASQLLGKRWIGQLLSVLMRGPQRFSGLIIRIEGLSSRILSERLRELEAEGIVRREVYPQMPVRVEYQLTEKGYALRPMVEAIYSWADQWVELPLPCANDHEKGTREAL